MNELTYHEKFILYLESLHRFNKDGIVKLVEFAEEQLPVLLRSNGLQSDGNLYSNLNVEYWDQVITDGLVDENSTNEERMYASEMMNALKLFRGFAKFNRTANYKQIFANNLKKEKAKVTKQRKDEATRNSIDNSVPEAENTIRPEGTVSQVCVTHYERNSEGRRRALEKYGYTCQVCGMNFEDVYGEIGHQYIEVHHLYPVCNMGENYQFDPLDEERGLVPLCSNCHSMIHRGGKIIVQNGEKVMVPMPLQALRDRIKVKKQI